MLFTLGFAVGMMGALSVGMAIRLDVLTVPGVLVTRLLWSMLSKFTEGIEEKPTPNRPTVGFRRF